MVRRPGALLTFIYSYVESLRLISPRESASLDLLLCLRGDGTAVGDVQTAERLGGTLQEATMNGRLGLARVHTRQTEGSGSRRDTQGAEDRPKTEARLGIIFYCSARCNLIDHHVGATAPLNHDPHTLRG